MSKLEEDPRLLASGRLDSWKEIADYLGKGVTTVRRWEKDEGLPVRRQEHLKRGSVVAYKEELDVWRDARTTALPEEPEPEPPNRRFRATFWILGGVAVAAVCLLVFGKMETSYVRVGGHVLTSESGGESHQSFEPGG